MTQPALLAKHIRDVHFGGNWTAVNLKDTLTGITLEQATTSIYSCHTIAALTFHINYYVTAILNVLRGTPLRAHDKYSFDVPVLHTEQEWEAFRNKVLQDAEEIAGRVAALPEEKLGEFFADEKYGTYHRNLLGLIEHTHYHLGQISLLKKIISQKESQPR
ncbi:MAG: DUF1572 domain-containing protein [Chitinophagaceae bacterium]